MQKLADHPGKQRVCDLLDRYRRRVAELLARARAQALVEPELDEAAATLFVGTVQGLVVQTLLAGDPHTLQPAAHRLWPLYLRS